MKINEIRSRPIGWLSWSTLVFLIDSYLVFSSTLIENLLEKGKRKKRMKAKPWNVRECQETMLIIPTLYDTSQGHSDLLLESPRSGWAWACPALKSPGLTRTSLAFYFTLTPLQGKRKRGSGAAVVRCSGSKTPLSRQFFTSPNGLLTCSQLADLAHMASRWLAWGQVGGIEELYMEQDQVWSGASDRCQPNL